MIIDGQKWACEACIRGHRVSGCSHSDRELKPIAKKGRPVSQCIHCRHLRKSRSAHVKCDCGDRHKSGKNGPGARPGPGTGPGSGPGAGNGNGSGNECGTGNGASSGTGPQPNVCCQTDNHSTTTTQCTCCHGGRCICAIKKESSLDPVPEIPSEHTIAPAATLLQPALHPMGEHRRPRLQATQSESSLTTFANGHHRPTHTHRAHHGISPYTIPGHTGLADVNSSRHSFLESDNIMARPTTTTTTQKPKPQSKARRVKSEQTSPNLISLSGRQPSTLDLNSASALGLTSVTGPRPQSTRMPVSLSVITNHSSFTTLHNQDYLLSADSDTHQFSAGLQPSLSANWPTSSYNFDEFNPGLDFFNFPPGLTSSSSGDENDDSLTLNMANMDMMRGKNRRTNVGNLGAVYGANSSNILPSDASDLEENFGYGHSAASSYVSFPPGLVMSQTQLEGLNEEAYIGQGSLGLERFLADPDQEHNGFTDTGSGAMVERHGFDVYGSDIFTQPSVDSLSVLASTVQSPVESTSGVMSGQTMTVEDDGIWMRPFVAPTYQQASEKSWAASPDQLWAVSQES